MEIIQKDDLQHGEVYENLAEEIIQVQKRKDINEEAVISIEEGFQSMIDDIFTVQSVGGIIIVISKIKK